MKHLLLGGYSYYSLLKDEKIYSQLFDKQISPLFKLLYDNPNFKFTFYLTGSEIEWIEKNRVDILRILSILLRRGSISILSSSFYQCFAPVATGKDIIEQTEYMRLRLRQIFKYKSKGFFVFNGLWQTDLIKPFSKADINYVIVPTTDCDLNAPFMMSEYGKKILVLPALSPISNSINKYLVSQISIERFSSQFAKEVDKVADFQTWFFNIDDFLRNDKDFSSFIKAIMNVYNDMEDLVFLTSDEIENISNISYMASGAYFGNKKFLQDLHNNPENLLKISRIQYIENIFSSHMQKKSDYDFFKPQLMKMLEGTQFLDRYSTKELDSEVYKNYIQSLSAILAAHIDAPAVLDMVTYSFMLIQNKNYIALLDTGDAVIKELGDFKTFVNLANQKGLFNDRLVFNGKKNQIVTYSSHNQFNLVEKKESRSHKVFTFLSKSFCNLSLSIMKQFVFKSSREIELNIEITNNADKLLSFSYSLLCVFQDIKDISTIDKYNTVFNVYLNNEKKKATTFFAEPGFKVLKDKKNNLLPTWDIQVEKGQTYKIDFKISF